MVKKSNYEYIIICGCGRIGALLARKLSALGKGVVMLDKNASAFRKLSGDYGGYTIEGDCTDTDILVQAKIEEADILISVTEDDNVNIFTSLVAKEIFKVKKVVTRLYDNTKLPLLKTKDIITICPTDLSIDEFNKLVVLKETL
jgi:trk system potassium uptake protein TrkA